MKEIIGKYHVTDCEHEGDLLWASQEVRSLGGKVLTTEWDGQDCGEAYVYFLMRDEQLQHLMQGDWSWSSAEYMRPQFIRRNLIK